MGRADKKQRHKAKREAKRREARRREGVGPLKRLAEAPGEMECWLSEGFEQFRQMQMFVYKRAAGLSGIACFLVDIGVVGLKDAWTKIGMDRLEFEGIIGRCEDEGFTMRKVGVEEIRRWVASGVRWAHENGMRLPKEWVKTASVIGGVGDWASADVSMFEKSFAGHPEDLRRRLIGEPFETYIQRKDVAFTFSVHAPYMDQETGDYVETGAFNSVNEEDEDDDIAPFSVEQMDGLVERFITSATALAGETGKWLAARTETASPELFEAWRSVMVASMLSRTAMPDSSEEEIADFGYELLEDLGERIGETRFAEYHRAVGQVLEHLQTDSQMMQKAVLKYGLTPEPDENAEES